MGILKNFVNNIRMNYNSNKFNSLMKCIERVQEDATDYIISSTVDSFANIVERDAIRVKEDGWESIFDYYPNAITSINKYYGQNGFDLLIGYIINAYSKVKLERPQDVDGIESILYAEEKYIVDIVNELKSGRYGESINILGVNRQIFRVAVKVDSIETMISLLVALKTHETHYTVECSELEKCMCENPSDYEKLSNQFKEIRRKNK